MTCVVPKFISLFVCLVMLTLSAEAAETNVAATCPRPAAGSVVAQPTGLYSHAGVLSVALDYVTSLDSANRTLFCFVTAAGVESPTLHVRPGDTLKITLHNRLPPLSAGTPRETMSVASNVCGSPTMDATSVNLHFHGTNTAPVCHSDEVVHTLVDSGETFTYTVAFPRDEPPGLYWYHPHVHGLSEAAVQGGASGAIIVDGIENLQPAVAGLPSRVLIIRDQNLDGFQLPASTHPDALQRPSWDVTLNYVPISYPEENPAVMQVRPGRKEFWRVLNASADTIMDLQLVYDGIRQPLEVVALDGVCTGSQDGSRRGKILVMEHILLPPAGRAEFIVTPPSAAVKTAALQTLNIQTGPTGDSDPERTLAVLHTGAGADDLPPMPEVSAAPAPQRFEGLDRAEATARRKLYFSEVPLNGGDDSQVKFFITVDGAKPTPFSPANPPAITTMEGSVEDWTIENRTLEVHEFHMHQIHFQLLGRNGMAVPASERQFYDTLQVPFWSGKGPYPSVTVRMDFRGRITGDFVYHCHILGHEDNGMMAIIRVLSRPAQQ